MTRVISFQSFAIGCVENDLFSLSTQQEFLKITDKTECIEQLNQLMPKNNRTKLVCERFNSVGEFDHYYKNWIEPIDNALNSEYSKKANVILIKLKLIEAESIRVFTE